MNVRAKFFCSAIKNMQWYPNQKGQAIVELTAAVGPGNETWAAATPSGRIEMTINNPEALAAFELGKFYFVDFRQEPPGPPDAPRGQEQVG